MNGVCVRGSSTLACQRWRDVFAMQWHLHRGRRSSWLLPVVAVGVAWPLSLLYASIGASGEMPPMLSSPALLRIAAASASLVQLIALFSGVVLGAADGRLSAGVLAVPRRRRLVLAKLGCAFGWWGPVGFLAMVGAPIAVVSVAGAGAFASGGTAAVGWAATARLLVSASVAVGLAATLGTALGLVLGSPLWAAGIGFAGFSLLPVLLAGLEGPREYLPGPALAQMVSDAWPSALPATAAAITWTVLCGLAAVVVAERNAG